MALHNVSFQDAVVPDRQVFFENVYKACCWTINFRFRSKRNLIPKANFTHTTYIICLFLTMQQRADHESFVRVGKHYLRNGNITDIFITLLLSFSLFNSNIHDIITRTIYLSDWTGFSFTYVLYIRPSNFFLFWLIHHKKIYYADGNAFTTKISLLCFILSNIFITISF